MSIKNAISGICFSAYHSDAVQKIGETLATRILLTGIGMITSIVVARLLGPEGRGLYAVAATIAALGVQFGTLGLPLSNTYYVAKDHELLRPLMSNSLLFSFGFGSLSAILAFCIFSIWPKLAPVNGVLLILGLTMIPINLAYQLLIVLLVGIQHIRAYNQIEITNGILNLSLICSLILINFVSPEMAFSASLAAIALSLVMLIFRLRYVFKKFQNSLNLRWLSINLFKENIRYGIKAYWSALFAVLVLKVDLLMVNHYLGANSSGLYSIAVSMANMIYLFPMVVGQIIFPKLCAMDSWQDKVRSTNKTSIAIGVFMVFIIAVAVYISDTAIKLLFGVAFVGAAAPFLFLMPGVFIWSIESIYRRLIISDDYRIGIVFGWAAAFLVNIIMNVFFIPKLGIKGAAIASSTALMVVAVVTALIFFRISFEKGRLVK